MLKSYERAGTREHVFLEDQERLCDALFADVGARYP